MWRGAWGVCSPSSWTSQSSQPRDLAWRRWSFTGLTRTLSEPWSPYQPPVQGGTDEPEAVEGDTGSGPTEHTKELAKTMPLVDVVGGTAFGRLAHEVLEYIDTSVTDLGAEMDRVVGDLLRRHRLPVSSRLLSNGLRAAMQTPLGAIVGNQCLADISPADRLAELTREPDGHFDELRALAKDPRFAVPGTVFNAVRNRLEDA